MIIQAIKMFIGDLTSESIDGVDVSDLFALPRMPPLGSCLVEVDPGGAMRQGVLASHDAGANVVTVKFGPGLRNVWSGTRGDFERAWETR